MCRNFSRLNRVLLGLLLSALLPSVSPAHAGSVMEWDFRDGATPAWQAGGDVSALRLTPEGLVVEPSGPAPTLIVSGLSIPADSMAFVRLRIRASRPINEAHFGWAAVHEGRQVRHASLRFEVSKGIRGSFPRTVWLRVAGAPDWTGKIESLGLILAADQTARPVVIEAVTLVPPGVFTALRAQWDALGLDDVAEDLAFPLWSLNTVKSVRIESWMLGDLAAWATCAGLIVVGLGRLAVGHPTAARVAVRLGSAVLVGVVVGLAALEMYVETRSFRIERAVFGARNSVDDYRNLDGFNLGAMAASLNRQYAAGVRIDVCPWGSPTARAFLVRRIRYELFPLRLIPDARLVVEFDEGRVICHDDDDPLVVSGDGYRVYERR